jgi:NADH-quinone oxidoreductase subunit E
MWTAEENNKEQTLPALFDKNKNEILDILAKYPTRRSAVLPLCQLAQKEYGHMSPQAVREVAEILELDPTEVQGLVGFYTLLRAKPTGEYVIEICNDLPCALRGADDFVEHVCQRLGVQVGETTEDGRFTVETVMCVAACNRAPVAQINLDYYENLDAEVFDRIVDQLIAEGQKSGKVPGNESGATSESQPEPPEETEA